MASVSNGLLSGISFLPFCDLISYSGKENQSATEFNQKWELSEGNSLAFLLQIECCWNLYPSVLANVYF